MKAAANVFTIPPSAPFLSTLVEALFEGRLVPGFRYRGEPLQLADVTIFLPTRRAAFALAEIIGQRLGGSAILPRIRPLGDVDDGDFDIDEEEDRTELPELPEAIDPLERQLTLARLILAWKEAAGADGRADRAMPLAVPSSPADALRLAAQLARLMDDIEIAGISWDRLNRLVPEDFAAYWQETLKFLKIAAEAWPAFLAAADRLDPMVRRNAVIEAETRRLAARRPRGPVIAAGSTGSIPATARLLAAIARLAHGAVVLPGLDRHLDARTLAAIGGSEEEDAAFSHPQYGMLQLTRTIGVTPEEVVALGEDATPPLAARAACVSEAMRPVATTDLWSEAGTGIDGNARAAAFADVDLIEAANEQQEALAIAIALREAIETDGTVAALVTPDRGLARRVVAELERWRVPVDDSAGVPLIETPAAILARLTAEAALGGAAPVTILSLLKHPLTALGRARAECRQVARQLEMLLLRGPRPRAGMAGLCQSLKEEWQAVERGLVRPSLVAARLDATAWEAVEGLLADLEVAMRPLETLAKRQDAVPLAELVAMHGVVLDALARAENGSAERLWQEEAGGVLAGLFDDVEAAGATAPQLRPAEYPAFLDALMAGVPVRRVPRAAPRVHIYGQLEARLQDMDMVVLGGLDEGVWPAETHTDPWLSRTMRRAIGLEPPERRIGLAAHDFCQALGRRRVVLARSMRQGGSPSVASRFLQRLTALAGEEERRAMRMRGQRYLDLARVIDRSGDAARPLARPAPCPPVAARPRKLSVTAIEELIRDPYAIYARHILQLEPLPAIGAEPDFALRGSLVHEALARFNDEWTGEFDETALRRLLEIGKAQFQAITAFPEQYVLWWPRFCRIARFFVEWERNERRPNLVRSWAEIPGFIEFEAPAGTFRLTARADRIEELRKGGLAILDYKTGGTRSARQVLSGLAPQLALEAAIARAGGFKDLKGPQPVAELAWLTVSGGQPAGEYKNAVEKGITAEDLAERALGRLKKLVAAFDDGEHGYVSRARPMFLSRKGRFDHLARVAEWSNQSENGGNQGGSPA